MITFGYVTAKSSDLVTASTLIMLSLLFRSLKKRQKDRKMSLVKEEAKEDSEEAVGLIMKVEKYF